MTQIENIFKFPLARPHTAPSPRFFFLSWRYSESLPRAIMSSQISGIHSTCLIFLLLSCPLQVSTPGIPSWQTWPSDLSASQTAASYLAEASCLCWDILDEFIPVWVNPSLANYSKCESWDGERSGRFPGKPDRFSFLWSYSAFPCPRFKRTGLVFNLAFLDSVARVEKDNSRLA